MAEKKKATTPKVAPKKEAVEVSAVAPEMVVAKAKKPIQFVVKRSTLIKIAIGVVIALVLIPVLDWVIQTSISSKYAAFYGNYDVSRRDYLAQLENQYGEEVLASLVAKSAVMQEAKAKGITVTEDEINASIAEVRKNFGLETEEKFNSALEEAGITKESFVEETRIVLLLNKIVADEVKEPTEEELQQYFKTNKDTLYVDQKYEDIKAKIAYDIKNAELSTKGQQWVAAKMDDYDRTNMLVGKQGKSYKFLRSFDLLKMLFAKPATADSK